MPLTFTTAGESHGPAVIATLFGLPFGHTLDVEFINAQLRRRQGGYGRGGRQNLERDRVEILSGLRRGVTIGSPLTLTIPNRDHRIDKAPDLSNVRPGHVDLAGVLKIGSRNARDVLERASARETAGRVMAGAACQSLLAEFGIHVVAHVLSVGGIEACAPYGAGHDAILKDAQGARSARDHSEVYTLDTSSDAKIKAEIDKAKADGDTLGGSIEIVADGVPVGLGGHNQWDDRLDGRLAQALMSIQAIKGVEVGLGAQAAKMRGSKVHDPILPSDQPDAAIQNPKSSSVDAVRRSGTRRLRRLQNPPAPYARGSNNAGGLEGGTSNGEAIVCRAHMKPISTLMNPLPSVDVATNRPARASTERSDTCAVPAAAVVAECAVAIVLAQALIEKTGGDSIDEMRRNFDGYLASLRPGGRE